MVFTGAGQGDIAHRDHFIHLHFVLNDGYLREIGVIEAGKNLIHIHFRDAMRGFHQAVIAQIQVKQLHDFGHVTRDKALAGFVIQFVDRRTQWRLQTARDQRFMNQGRFFTE